MFVIGFVDKNKVNNLDEVRKALSDSNIFCIKSNENGKIRLKTECLDSKGNVVRDDLVSNINFLGDSYRVETYAKNIMFYDESASHVESVDNFNNETGCSMKWSRKDKKLILSKRNGDETIIEEVETVSEANHKYIEFYFECYKELINEKIQNISNSNIQTYEKVAEASIGVKEIGKSKENKNKE